ncbi:Nn.00g060930.m01.CDS01 [Neocucurbitaria sp. VM-36]
MNNTNATAISGKNVAVKPLWRINAKRQVFESTSIIGTGYTEAINILDIGKQRKTSFLDLPREVRDMVYSYYWQTRPCLNVSSTPFGRFSLQLRYEGHYKMHVGHFGHDSIERLDGRWPWWLMSNKQILCEALEQFVYKAEWFWDGYPMAERKQYRQSSLLEPSKISHMTLHVDSFGSYENPPRHMDRCYADKNLKILATAIARDQKTYGRIQRLRISGCSRMLHHGGSEMLDQAKSITEKIMECFKTFHVEQLELEVFNKDPDRRRILYEINGRGSTMKVVVKEDEKHKNPQQERISPPSNGWTEAQWMHFDCLERAGVFLQRR